VELADLTVPQPPLIMPAEEAETVIKYGEFKMQAMNNAINTQ